METRPELLRDGLLLALTMTSGYLDGGAYLGFGHVFIANMTGNTVLFGLSAGRGQLLEALRNGASFGGFAVGSFVGTRLAGRGARRPFWSEPVTQTLAFELVLVLVVALGWWCAGSHPAGSALLPLAVVAAGAMGIQSAAARRLAVSDVSTTYVTGTLTALMGELAILRGPRSAVRHAAVLVTLCLGAALGALFIRRWPALLPVPPLVLCAGVTLTAVIANFTRRDAVSDTVRS